MPAAANSKELLTWLLEEDEPGVRYLALRAFSSNPAEIATAQQRAHLSPPISTVLDAMHPDGYWEKPGSGYSPKYKSAVWALTLLAQLGAEMQFDPRIAAAVEYALHHTLRPNGLFSSNNTPAGIYDCLMGNMCFALYSLGCRDERLMQAFSWMARLNTQQGVASLPGGMIPSHLSTTKTGPCFQCAINGGQSCAWGAVKVLKALTILPIEARTDEINAAIDVGVEFLLSVDPVGAAWPHADAISPYWHKPTFPLYYTADLLQVAEVLAQAGALNDPRAENLVRWIQAQAGPDGRWPLSFSLYTRSWGNFGRVGQPNKWVTLRALRVLNAL